MLLLCALLPGAPSLHLPQESVLWGPALFYLKELSILVSTFNICLDPLIYFIFCKAFRAKLGQIRQHNSSQNQEGAASAGHTKQEVGAVGQKVDDMSTTETQLYSRRKFRFIRQENEIKLEQEAGQASESAPDPHEGLASGAAEEPASEA